MNKSVNLRLDSLLYNELEKRAKKEFLQVDELIEDIIRRSMLTYKRGIASGDKKVDDKLIGIFSRSKRGRKRK